MFLMGVPTGNAGENSELVFKHLGNTYALAELKSDVTDLAFPTHVTASAIESRLDAPRGEVALNR
jgi:hypothetical protein